MILQVLLSLLKHDASSNTSRVVTIVFTDLTRTDLFTDFANHYTKKTCSVLEIQCSLGEPERWQILLINTIYPLFDPLR